MREDKTVIMYSEARRLIAGVTLNPDGSKSIEVRLGDHLGNQGDTLNYKIVVFQDHSPMF